MKHLISAAAAASLLLAGTAVAAPSAKFAATYHSGGMNVVSMAVIDDATADTIVMDQNEGYTFAQIKVPQNKELMVGLSAEIGLTTDTSIKGQQGGSARAIAGASAQVVVFACPVDGGACTAAAKPGQVTLSSRVQELDATLGGVLEDCEDLNGDGVVEIPEECTFSDEEIGLAIDTLASHHFNFVLPDMDQGDYNVVAYFMTGALAQIDIDEISVDNGGTVSASAFAKAWIGSYMLTVQQVRATNDGIIDVDIIE
jgi:hypothetical protein